MWELGLKQYAEAVGIDWEWMAMDGALVKAPLGKIGHEGSLLCDGKGMSLAIVRSTLA